MMKHDGGGIVNDWDQGRRVADMANGPWQLFRSVSKVYHLPLSEYRANFSSWTNRAPCALCQFCSSKSRASFKTYRTISSPSSTSHAIRYMNHNGTDQVPTIMEGMFDDYKIDPHGNCKGGAEKGLLPDDWMYLGLDFASWVTRPYVVGLYMHLGLQSGFPMRRGVSCSPPFLVFLT
jgi:hypothetical protein